MFMSLRVVHMYALNDRRARLSTNVGNVDIAVIRRGCHLLAGMNNAAWCKREHLMKLIDYICVK